MFHLLIAVVVLAVLVGLYKVVKYFSRAKATAQATTQTVVQTAEADVAKVENTIVSDVQKVESKL